MNFSSYASKLLSQQPTGEEPLFYSIQSNWEVGFNPADDILGNSDNSINNNHHSRQYPIRGRTRQQELEEQEEEDEDDRILDGELNEQRIEERGIVESNLITNTKQQISSISSKLWERSKIKEHTTNISRGWKAHESITTPFLKNGQIERYSEEDDELEEEDDEDNDPPTFLSPLPAKHINILPSSTSSTSSSTRREPLIPSNKSLYVSPKINFNVGGARRIIIYKNSSWIVIYGIALITTFAIILQEIFSSSKPTTNLPTLLPSIPSLEILSLISLSTGLISLFYLLTLQKTIRNFIYTSLVLSPVLFIFIGIYSISQSFDHFTRGNGTGAGGGVEEEGGWKVGVRIFGLGMIVGGILLGRYSLGKRKKVERCAKVLELSTSLLLLNPPLLLLSLSLSLVSLLLSLTFLHLLSLLISHSSLSQGIWFFSAGFKPLYLLFIYLWTLGILKGVQKVVVGSVVGGWWFERSEEENTVEGGREGGLIERLGDESVWEVTKGGFARATGSSLGTIILSSLLLSLSQTILFLSRRTQSLLRSTSLPFFLNPLTILVPILGILVSMLEYYNGFLLTYVGLTGSDWSETGKGVRELLGRGGISDNLLVRFIISLSTITFSLVAGSITFFLISSSSSSTEGGEEIVKLSPWIAFLCFLIPYWSLKFCSSLIQDSVDACFLCYNSDLDKNTNHCDGAVEAFGEPVYSNSSRV